MAAMGFTGNWDWSPAFHGRRQSMGLVYPSLGKPCKTDLPTKEELSEESREGTARKGEKLSLTENENGIVIHERTGERFNNSTKEFEW